MKAPTPRPYTPASRLSPHLKEIDRKIHEWSRWLVSFADHRHLPVKQIYGLGMMATRTVGQNRQMPLWVQQLDLVIAALCRSDPILKNVLWSQYFTEGMSEEKAAALSMDERSFKEYLRNARDAVFTTMTFIESRDLMARSVGIKRRKESGRF